MSEYKTFLISELTWCLDQYKRTKCKSYLVRAIKAKNELRTYLEVENYSEAA